MTQVQKSYTAAFKTKAVQKYMSGKDAMHDVAKSLGISPSALKRWNQQMQAAGPEGLTNTRRGPPRQSLRPADAPVPKATVAQARPAATTAAMTLAKQSQPTKKAQAEIVPCESVLTGLYTTIGRLTVENESLRRQLGET